MALSNWPTIVDDDGSLTLGTVINKAVFDAIKASVEDDLFSTVNPAITAEDIIDEVVAARGSVASLDARLDVALNEDGTLKPQANLVSDSDLFGSIGHGNWVHNDDFLIWAFGDSVAPTAWTLSGVTCARAGVGLADTNTKAGSFCAKLTRAGVSGGLTQAVVGTGSMGVGGVYLRGRDMSFGCWVYSATAGMVRIYLNDGVGSTYAEDSDANTYHPGDSTWRWFSGTHTVALGATTVLIGASLENSNGDAYISGATVIPSSVAPSAWVPCNKSNFIVPMYLNGTLSVSTPKLWATFTRPAILTNMWAYVITAPTGADIILDFNNRDGAAYQSMFAGAGSRMTLTPALARGFATPDGTYRYRCFEPLYAAALSDAGLLSVDVDQVGSGTAGANLYVFARMLQYDRPQESLLAYNDWR